MNAEKLRKVCELPAAVAAAAAAEIKDNFFTLKAQTPQCNSHTGYNNKKTKTTLISFQQDMRRGLVGYKIET